MTNKLSIYLKKNMFCLFNRPPSLVQMVKQITIRMEMTTVVLVFKSFMFLIVGSYWKNMKRLVVADNEGGYDNNYIRS